MNLGFDSIFFVFEVALCQGTRASWVSSLGVMLRGQGQLHSLLPWLAFLLCVIVSLAWMPFVQLWGVLRLGCGWVPRHWGRLDCSRHGAEVAGALGSEGLHEGFAKGMLQCVWRE